MNTYVIQIINIGNEFVPKWRLRVNDVIVGRGSIKDCLPLMKELQESEEKTKAIYDMCNDESHRIDEKQIFEVYIPTVETIESPPDLSIVPISSVAKRQSKEEISAG